MKESDAGVLTDLQPMTNEAQALTADAVFAESDKRQMIIDCMESTDTVLATVGEKIPRADLYHNLRLLRR